MNPAAYRYVGEPSRDEFTPLPPEGAYWVICRAGPFVYVGQHTRQAHGTPPSPREGESHGRQASTLLTVFHGPMRGMAAGTKLIAENRRARHEYHLLERYEAGLVLTGTEVKSLRDGKAILQRAFGDLRDGELYLVGAHIPEYTQGNVQNHDPDRDRKLLLHRRELDQLVGKVQEKGLTLVPTRLYWKDGRAKVELALARGKDVRDKRRDIADRDARRQIERALKTRDR